MPLFEQAVILGEGIIDLVVFAKCDKGFCRVGQEFILVPNDIEVTPENQILNAYGYNQSLIQCRKDHPVRQNGNPQAVNGRVDKGGGTHGFPDCGDIDARLGDGTVEYFPCAASMFPQKKALLLKFFNTDDLPLPPPLVGGTDPPGGFLLNPNPANRFPCPERDQ